ncbi:MULTISPECIES: TonB-dependent receptor [unclassified Colwellia]|uniref:TonB-dependent receptor n=1 Tax=unclassified Colwellia TaxID=196834 RepID=UPI0015F6432C|nr:MULTISPECIES: TonB-dependent receptor [unclassified Colwellia]MBA6378941.1 TonB-dependent receptor [Colwellia sp. BRX10-7]MBA6386644.1 TonB-dependent receptor [Colwellia sp. BRX10-2]MBA6401049.1 TonB-dependent receptor [Colwellia sp. BRX10-5]MBA6405664.1 TonB-dependent receptor [Colwellia sp. BRX10-1]
MNTQRLSLISSAVIFALGLSTSAMANDTSSAIRGSIENSAGAISVNAKIEIIHEPSGTKTLTTSNDAGNFSSKGLRVGGPYTIKITGEKGVTVYRDIFLTLGDTFRLNAKLEAADDVERISVTGSKIFSNNIGSNSYFGADDIVNAPSFDRDIKDIVRNNPLAVLSSKDGELSVAGTNPRFNSISVDGISQNDDFGLNANGYPTTRSPISLDAIEQVTIDVTPFNAKDSGFQGAKINAVTKSGTNELSGSFFYETQNDGMAGTPKNGTDEAPLDFDETTFGATLGGAIIEDELFFFASYEYYEATSTVEWGPDGANVPNSADASVADVLEVQRIAREVYGVEPGEWDLSPKVDDEKLLLKLDWNINDDHRSAFTYQYTKGNSTRNQSTYGGELRLSSHWYDRTEELNNYAFKLYSDWNDDFSTQLSLTYLDNPTTQASLGDYSDTVIQAESGDIAIGADHSRHSNDLRKKTFIMALDGDYLVGDHSLSFGYQFKRLDIFNLFLQNTKGDYRFGSIEDFENRVANRVIYQNATSLDPNDAAASFVRDEHAFYIQDEWMFNDDITIDMGLRYEMLASSDKPTYNEQSQARTGFDNTDNLDGTGIFLPRFGIKWDASDDLIVRGGVGRYSGGQPTVWVSNSYSNPGVGIGEVFANGSFENVDISGPRQEDKDAVANSTTFAGTNFVDPNFDLPSDWRYQIALDYRFDIPVLGEDFLLTTEYLYKKSENTAFWQDASLFGDEDGTTADGGRTIYDDADGSISDLMLTNAGKDGRSKIFSVVLNKDWDSGVRLTTSYTNQDVTDAHTSASATAGSNYGFNTTINRNDAVVGRSGFETEHRFVVNLGYETEFVAGYKTNINLFFERRSGKPVTFYADGTDVDGRSGPGSDPYGLLSPGTTSDSFLPYIPTPGDTNVVFSSAENEANFFEAINDLGLDKYAGGYLPKGVITTPWVTTLDLSIRQEIPGFKEGHKGMVYLTVDNLLNLVDSSKGKVYGSDFGTQELVEFTVDPATRQYVYGRSISQNDDGSYADNKFYTTDSAWRIKVGVSYKF